MKKYNAFELKLFMAFLMVFDHLWHIPDLVPFEWVGIFHALTRCVGVWFAYMAVEGFIHTRSRIKYNARLFLWAAIMYGGNTLLNYLYQSNGVAVYNNIFLTIAIGVLILNVIYYPIDPQKPWGEKIQKAVFVIRILLGVAIAVSAYMFVGAEGALPMIPFMVICYALRDKTRIRNIVLLCMAIPMIIMSYVPYESLSDTIFMMLYNCEGFFITVIPFIYLYNGQRGLNNKFSKYFFYVFYPAHLWIIATVAYFIG